VARSSACRPPADKALASEILKAGAAAAAHADAEDRRKAALKESNSATREAETALKRATEAAEQYRDGLLQQTAELGRTPAELIRMKAAMEAAKAPTAALAAEIIAAADTWATLSERQKMVDATADPAAKAQDTLRKQMAFLREEVDAGRMAFDAYIAARDRAYNATRGAGQGQYVNGVLIGEPAQL